MGVSGGSKTTKSTQNQQTSGVTSATTTPNVPGFASDVVQNYYSQLGNFSDRLLRQPDMLATPTNALLQTASNNALNLPTGYSDLSKSSHLANSVGNAIAPTIDPVTKVAAGNGITTTKAKASSLLEGLDSYFNPYEDRVIDTTLAEADLESARQQAAYKAAAARGGAFGGSRDAIAQSQLTATQERQRAGIEAELRAAGFDKATAMSLADAQMRTQTSQFNAGQANAASLASAQIAAENARADAAAANQRAMQQAQLEAANRDRALSAAGILTGNASTGSQIANNNAATQAGIGQSLWDIDQYNNAAQIAGLGAYQGLLSGYEPFVGQTINGTESGTLSSTGTEKTTSSGGLLGKIAGALQVASSAASLFSDARLKTDIRRVGQTDAGLPIYTYRYKGDDTPQMGVMAQDVEMMQPDALGPDVGGFKTVRYAEVR